MTEPRLYGNMIIVKGKASEEKSSHIKHLCVDDATRLQKQFGFKSFTIVEAYDVLTDETRIAWRAKDEDRHL